MKQRTVSFGWKEDVHDLTDCIVRERESGERVALISMVSNRNWVSAIVVYEQDGGAE